MKYAIVNEKKTEAFKGASGICPFCNSAVIAKCGEIKVDHWAHKGNRNCDHWWENETEWHRQWKGNYPIEWQEVVHFDGTGEKHIADVKTETGLVIEFQHSYLKPEERRSRINFYQKLIWVVDGTRRIKDRSTFIKALNEGLAINLKQIQIFQVNFPEESRILKEWVKCGVPVFFDFHEPERLWLSIPFSNLNSAYIIRVSREYFLEISKDNSLEKVVNDLVLLIREYTNYIKRKNEQETNGRVNQTWRNSIRKKPRRRF